MELPADPNLQLLERPAVVLQTGSHCFTTLA
jgi:hypothetical protein